MSSVPLSSSLSNECIYCFCYYISVYNTYLYAAISEMLSGHCLCRFSSSVFRSVPFCCRTQGEYCIILYNTAVAVGYETHMRNMEISDQQQAIMDWRYPFPHLLISHVQITAYSYCIPRDRLTGYLTVSGCTLLIPYRYKTIVNRWQHARA